MDIDEDMARCIVCGVEIPRVILLAWCDPCVDALCGWTASNGRYRGGDIALFVRQLRGLDGDGTVD